MDIRSHVARRLKEERARRGWSLDALAVRAGVSRAMLSKIERGVSVPTTVLLARVGDALGVGLTSLMRPAPPAGRQPVSRLAAQAQWTDPATGYTRRIVSPAEHDGDVEVVAVELPPAARVAFPAAASLHVEGKLVLLQGRLLLEAGSEAWALEPGDCARLSIHRAHALHNPGDTPARYLVVTRPSSAVALP